MIFLGGVFIWYLFFLLNITHHILTNRPFTHALCAGHSPDHTHRGCMSLPGQALSVKSGELENPQRASGRVDAVSIM